MGNSDLITPKDDYADEAQPHPTKFIDDELRERGWTHMDLADRIAPMFPNFDAAMSGGDIDPDIPFAAEWWG